jgi:hypothetical protein
MNQALYAHMNNKRKMKKKVLFVNHVSKNGEKRRKSEFPLDLSVLN